MRFVSTGIEGAAFATSVVLGAAIQEGLREMRDSEDRRRTRGWLEHFSAQVQAERARACVLEAALVEARAEAVALADDVDDLEAEVIALRAEVVRLRRG